MGRKPAVSTEGHAIVSVDVVLFTLVDRNLRLALAERTHEPFRGRLALIGGYVHPEDDRDATAAARRILAEKAGLPDVFVEQLMTFSGADRDPRGWSVSIAYYALIPHAVLRDGTRPSMLSLFPVTAVPPLPFDHDLIVKAALERLRNKSSYSSLPALLLPEQFTFPELKSTYDAVMGTNLNDSAFRRKISDLGIIEEVLEAKSPATAARRRPAQLYRLKQRALVAFDTTV